jgi:hypothetical protein
MEGVDLDAAQRRFIWPDGERLDLDQSAAYIHKQYPDARVHGRLQREVRPNFRSPSQRPSQVRATRSICSSSSKSWIKLTKAL